MENKNPNNFERFAIWFGDFFGSPISFILSVIVVIGWLSILGPLLHWSNTWQLLINTPTTIIELFAAITIQYVGNRIQRHQRESEERMLTLLENIEKIAKELEVDLGAVHQDQELLPFTNPNLHLPELDIDDVSDEPFYAEF